MACSKDVLGAIKGLFRLFKNGLWPVCGQIYGLNCECLWHVQRIILGAVCNTPKYTLAVFGHV